MDEYTVIECFLRCYDDIHERYYAAHATAFNKLIFLDRELYKVHAVANTYMRGDLVTGLRLLSMQAEAFLPADIPLSHLCDRAAALIDSLRNPADFAAYDTLSRDYAIVWRENEELKKKIGVARAAL